MKRIRGPNFTREELIHLLRLIEKYPVVNSPETDGFIKGSKSKAWRSIMMEYNSQTRFIPRTAANLLSCYRNYKMRVKKLRQRNKISGKEPKQFDVLEMYNQSAVEQVFLEESSSDCQTSFNHSIQIKKEEDSNKGVNYRGQHQQPSSSSSSSKIEKGECFYTTYEGDSDFMRDNQDSHDYPSKPTILPIEGPPNSNQCSQEDQTTDDENDGCEQINNKRKKCNLSSERVKTDKKNGVTDSFKELAENKKELAGSQKILASLQIQHEEIKIQLLKEQLRFSKKKNELELEFIQQKHELELTLLRRKYE